MVVHVPDHGLTHGVLRVEPVLLVQHAHADAAAAGDPPGVRLLEPGEDPHEGGLAVAVAADQADAVAGLDAEVLAGGVEKRARSYPDFEIIGYNHEEIV